MKFFDINKDAELLLESGILKKIKSFLKNGIYINGQENSQLENQLKRFTGAKFCQLCSSGTDALMASLMCLGLKKGDEIITSPYSWVSVAEVAKILGLKIKFADIDVNNFNISLNSIRKVCSKKTKVIIPVSIFGMCPNLLEIKRFTKKNNFFLIEDAAQSFGASILKKNSCNIADISCTSFFPTKILGGYGDGGAIFTNNKNIHSKIKKIVNHGSLNKKNFDIIGMNARMDTIQSIFLLEKIKNIKGLIKKRIRISKVYNNFFNSNNITGLQKNNLQSHSVYAQYTILVRNRKKFINFLDKYKIPHMIYYKKPLYKNSAYYQNIFLKNTEFVSKHSVSLPMNLHDIKKTYYIIKKLEKIKNDKNIFFKTQSLC